MVLTECVNDHAMRHDGVQKVSIKRTFAEPLSA
jgi:hypothetical protein